MAISLDDIRKAADKKFAPVEFDLQDGKDPVRIKNPLRLDKKVRDAVSGMLESLRDGEAEDVAEVVAGVFKKVIDKPADAKRLIDAADGDAAILLQFLNAWQEGEAVGEASDSQD